jgi:hypothetical protein
MTQKKKNKMINNDLQSITQKTEDQARRTPLTTGVDMCINVTLFSCTAFRSIYIFQSLISGEI